MKINGDFIISLGYRPSRWFKEVLNHVNNNDVDLTEQEIIDFIRSVAPKETSAIDLHQDLIPYYKNIFPSTLEDFQNVQEVCKTMDVLMKTPTIVNGAIMPDACPCGNIGQIPVGGVAVAKNAIHPGMHSADICCSLYLSTLTNANPKKVLDVAEKVTHFGQGGRRIPIIKLPDDLLDKIKSNHFLNNTKSIELAKTHLGTQGDGNHFLFVGISKNTKKTVVVTHHGSRGFGALLYKNGMRIAERFRQRISPNTLRQNAWIPFDTDEGREYWNALQIVREWTKLNHQIIHEEIFKVLDVDRKYDISFWNEHNFVFKDNDLFYHAKGATPLDDKFVKDSLYGLRIIPLNMHDGILVVRGQTTETNLGFAPHGAGRNMSRTKHKELNKDRTIKEIFESETSGLDVRFFSKNVDITELPSAYKDAESIKEQIKIFNLGEIRDEIKSYGCIMAGRFENRYRSKQK